jgi:hypothetical protein
MEVINLLFDNSLQLIAYKIDITSNSNNLNNNTHTRAKTSWLLKNNQITCIAKSVIHNGLVKKFRSTCQNATPKYKIIMEACTAFISLNKDNQNTEHFISMIISTFKHELNVRLTQTHINNIRIFLNEIKYHMDDIDDLFGTDEMDIDEQMSDLIQNISDIL